MTDGAPKAEGDQFLSDEETERLALTSALRIDPTSSTPKGLLRTHGRSIHEDEITTDPVLTRYS
jgi:hypothetical protein